MKKEQANSIWLNRKNVNSILIYTDGSAYWKNKFGGIGILINNKGNKVEFNLGPFKDTTTQEMELGAVIYALKMVLEINKKTKIPIELYSDSQYSINMINENWLENWERFSFVGKKNQEFLIEFLKIYREYLKNNIKFVLHHVRGHQGIIGNEIVDKLANEAYQKHKSANFSKLIIKKGTIFQILNTPPNFLIKGEEKNEKEKSK